jgi:23S rRNA pseudouridine2604 synthase
LDKDSQGLIFLTNNGDMVNKILRAGNNHEKEYVVTVDKPLTERVIQGMAAGLPMLGITTKKCKVEQMSTYVFKIILVQGLNRQIRRMCEHFGYEVTRLERIRIMDIGLKGLPTGDWRDLTDKEMQSINKLIAASSSESKPHKNNNKPEHEKSISSEKKYQKKKEKNTQITKNKEKLNHHKSDKYSKPKSKQGGTRRSSR